MALAIAAMTVMVRRHKNTSMVAAAALSNILGSVISIPFAHGIAAVAGFDLFILAMFGSFRSRWASRCSSSARACCHPARPP